MRSVAREIVFEYLFSRLFNQKDEGLFAVLCKNLNQDDKEFAEKLLNSVIDSEDVYAKKIQDLSENFKYERIFAADKCAISIGMFILAVLWFPSILSMTSIFVWRLIFIFPLILIGYVLIEKLTVLMKRVVK